VRSVLLAALPCILCAASFAARCEEPVAAIGKQRALSSAIEWVVNDVSHPLMGPIRFAVQKNAIGTSVKNGKIVSLAYLSCQKGSGKMAIELANSLESNPAGGLGPTDMPRLVCNGLRPEGDIVKNDLAASWEIDALGDTLARGLSPAALRRCVSIQVLQNVALPPGLGQESQRVAMEIAPYNREVDSIFAACGEATAFAAEATPPMAAARPVPAGKPPAVRFEAGTASEKSAAAPADPSWRPARATRKGRTNVRAAASLDSSVVIQIDPGTRILVQRASADWWKVKPRTGAGFSGYVRQDRFTFE
jgi:hypothetical protein